MTSLFSAWRTLISQPGHPHSLSQNVGKPHGHQRLLHECRVNAEGGEVIIRNISLKSRGEVSKTPPSVERILLTWTNPETQDRSWLRFTESLAGKKTKWLRPCTNTTVYQVGAVSCSQSYRYPAAGNTSVQKGIVQMCKLWNCAKVQNAVAPVTLGK